MMMKGDVLSGFETLKVCTEYNYKGEKIAHFPQHRARNVTCLPRLQRMETRFNRYDNL
jgi:adenylosuccinate synthase